jgi:hypothetical protein
MSSSHCRLRRGSATEPRNYQRRRAGSDAPEDLIDLDDPDLLRLPAGRGGSVSSYRQPADSVFWIT